MAPRNPNPSPRSPRRRGRAFPRTRPHPGPRTPRRPPGGAVQRLRSASAAASSSTRSSPRSAAHVGKWFLSWEKEWDWKLGEWDKWLGLNLGMEADLDYTLGQPLSPDIFKLKMPDIFKPKKPDSLDVQGIAQVGHAQGRHAGRRGQRARRTSMRSSTPRAAAELHPRRAQRPSPRSRAHPRVRPGTRTRIPRQDRGRSRRRAALGACAELSASSGGHLTHALCPPFGVTEYDHRRTGVVPAHDRETTV